MNKNVKIAPAFIVIYAFCFLFYPNILAQDLTRDNYYKAVDYLNCKTVELSLNLSETKGVLTNFQSQCNCREIPNPNSNKIKESIPQTEKEAQLLTDEIDKLKNTDVPSTEKAVIEFLSSEVFANKEKFPALFNFAEKYSVQIKDKNGVYIVPINKLKDQLKKEIPELFSAQQQSADGVNESRAVKDGSTSSNDGSFFSFANFTYGISFLLPIVAILFGGFVYWDLNRKINKLERINKLENANNWKPKAPPAAQPKAISKNDMELESRLKTALSNELDQKLRDEFARLESRIKNLENPQTENWQSKNLTSRNVFSEIPAVREDKESREEVFYFPKPNDDKAFSVNAAQSTFKEGESIYKFRKVSKNQAQFNIDDRDSSTLIALRYPEAIIEPACDAQNSRADSEKRIVTIEPGIAVLDGNVWKIVKKAVIRYEH